jgi:hypothetical protein
MYATTPLIVKSRETGREARSCHFDGHECHGLK